MAQDDDDLSPSPAYRTLLAEIDQMALETAERTGITHFSLEVMSAIGKVPRHRFVPPEQERYACGNYPLSIGYGQTISQPYIVALMSELLRLDKRSIVLEIGSGCGYQTAVLAELAMQVYSIEIIEPLARMADQRLKALGYTNATIRVADGHDGWPEMGPFDAIIVTAAADDIPQPLVDQLKPGGRMVIPIGKSYLAQDLLLIEKGANGLARRSVVLPVRFVPMTGKSV